MSAGTIDVRRVLVVDRDIDTAGMLRAMPHRRADVPIAIDSAETVADALPVIAERRHDVYLVDFEMDQASGGELLRAAATAGDGAVVALLEGPHDARTEHAVFNAGASGFVWKDELSAPVLAYVLRHARAARERTRLERQVYLERRMESIGQLAGGIAHDFNNILTAIIGFATLLGEQVARREAAASESVEEILVAADRASSLTRQLLAFGRRQVMHIEAVDVAEMVQRLTVRLDPALCEHIALDVVCPANLPLVRADSAQIEQAISMLVMNAVEAMPAGGRITIEADAVTLDEAYCSEHVSVQPGAYVRLAVSDTGEGMTPDALSRIFEPFFTRREGETLAGFGLAAVHGIVQQMGGSIWPYSEPGIGTTFKIYLPVEARTEALLSTEPVRSSGAMRPKETILLVDDTVVVRRLAQEVLSRAGYQVLDAGGADEALQVASGHHDAIDLLVTDVIMPGPNGVELAERLQAIRGNVPVLFMSGYADNAVVRSGLLANEAAFLQKPFTPTALLDKVRQVLGGRGATRA
jgi:signal transduction histidine kinase